MSNKIQNICISILILLLIAVSFNNLTSLDVCQDTTTMWETKYNNYVDMCDELKDKSYNKGWYDANQYIVDTTLKNYNNTEGGCTIWTFQSNKTNVTKITTCANIIETAKYVYEKAYTQGLKDMANYAVTQI